MPENRIGLAPSNEYRIYVNDDNEYISFDLDDSRLTTRFMRTIENLNALESEYSAKAAAIEKRSDKPRIAISDDTSITQNQYDVAMLADKLYEDSRRVFDEFLGAGACQKIFGDRNWYTMFDDLLEQLEPHFKKMGLSAAKIRKNIAEKYAPNRAARRALK